MASKDKGTATPNSLKESSSIHSSVVQQCQEGHREAERQIYEQTSNRVYRLMTKLVGTQDAGDVTQQVYLQLFRKIGQFAGDARFETWLYRLATNEALQHLRRKQRRKFHPLAHEPMSLDAEQPQIVEQHELLKQALGRLEPELRSIFVLREIEKLSYSEIAEVANIPGGTVGSRLNRARHELREHLAALGWES